jgi:2-polyprenyl-3-methyl-5-hydroxy-6-metoxy-1,4-benzoquinol methylase
VSNEERTPRGLRSVILRWLGLPDRAQQLQVARLEQRAAEAEARSATLAQDLQAAVTAAEARSAALAQDLQAAVAAAEARSAALAQDLQAAVAAAEARGAALAQDLQAVAAAAEARSAELAEASARIAQHEWRIGNGEGHRLAQDKRLDDLASHIARWQADNPEPSFDYLGFENRFRGSEALIRERQTAYLEAFPAGGVVLDIGCGRGEFLELLQASGRVPLGIDTEPGMVEYCRQKGLSVEHGHALEYLSGLEDASLDGIFAAQVIEHVSFAYATRWVEVAFQKLRPGGVLIMETVNPHCPEAMGWFFLDPTHLRPIYPEYLQFLYESKGFANVYVRYTTVASYAQDRAEAERGPRDFGDYAVIGVKQP